MVKAGHMTKFLVLNGFSIEPDKLVTDEHGNQRKVEVAKRFNRWWTAIMVGLSFNVGAPQSNLEEVKARDGYTYCHTRLQASRKKTALPFCRCRICQYY